MNLSRGFVALVAGLLSVFPAALAGAAPADNIAAVPAPGTCISTAHACVSVPVVFTRVDATPVRGYSVTYHFSGNLVSCATPTAGTYLSNVNPSTSFEFTDNGDGTYTVDQVILGTPCGATGSGTLFTLSLSSADTSGFGSIVIDSVSARDCDNFSVTAAPGDSALLNIDKMSPSPVSDLTAVAQMAGNGYGQTSRVLVSFTRPADATQFQVYRAGYGDYPEYASGSVPASPAYPPSAPWTLTSVTDSGQFDAPPVRDYVYYVVFSLDSCGNASQVSNRAGGVLDYFLGDVTNDTTPGTGDNLVTAGDVSLLGAHYGLKGAAVAPYAYLDFGPTETGSVHARPVPDEKINFEDLMLLAINFGQVGKPAYPQLVAAAADRLTLDVSEDLAGGLSGSLHFAGTGALHGITTRLAWNAAVVAPVGYASGELLDRNGGMALSDAAGSVDVAVLGSGEGLAGEGTLAVVNFRRIASGEPGIRIAVSEGRDAANRPVDLLGKGLPQGPRITALRAATPNPFRSGTTLSYSLATAGTASLTLHSVDGRRVRTLASGLLAAGDHSVTWDGTDASGRRMGPGVYFVRLQTAGGSYGRVVTLLR